MKALSLRQPWAWLVVHGHKGLENRKWNTKFRGDFLIHAVKTMTRDDYTQASAAVALHGHGVQLPAFDSDELLRGGIVGAATIIGAMPPCYPKGLFSGRICVHPWHMPEQYGFVLRAAHTLPFRALDGRLSFFDVRELR